METIEFLQAYWWLLISVLGALLVFLLFVQGGQSMLHCNVTDEQRQLMVNSLGRKWEFTYTTLVVFGGAFFAAFPLFYSTSFGGAYWLWMLILLSFVLQAVSYEFRRKRGNLYGTGTYDAFLMFNGLVGCVLLGVAVSTFFTGGAFVVTKTNILNPSNPIISTWASTHGLETIANPINLLLGFAVFFLARTMACLYFINNIEDADLASRMKKNTLINGLIFAVLFVAYVAILMFRSGYQVVDGAIVEVPYLYLQNLLGMWWFAVLFLLGVVAVLYAIFRTAFGSYWTKGVWFAGVGVVVVVICLFGIAGYNGTAYLPSTLDMASSLTLCNSSSSEFTLKVMAYVSIVIPFVLAYIWYVWAKMNSGKLTKTEIDNDSHSY